MDNIKLYNTGCIKSPKDLRNYKISKSCIRIELPTSFQVPHGIIKNQEQVGSCVAHSLSSLLETKDNIIQSTAWIYGYRPEPNYQGIGMCPIEALKTVKKVGYLTQEQLPGNYEMNKAKIYVSEKCDIPKIIKESPKISTYAELHNINEIKSAIYNSKQPVLVSIDVGNHCLELDENYIAYIPKAPGGLHQVLCYGWNEKGLLIQNSWGENWGKNGCFILPYDYPIEESWMIEFKKPEPIKPKEELINKPNWFVLRKLIMIIIKLFKNKKGGK